MEIPNPNDVAIAVRSQVPQRAAYDGRGTPQQPAAMTSPVPSGACCYLCLDGDAQSPLVRNCACRGSDAGYVHMNCLIQAARHEPRSWYLCSLCKQEYYGEVRLALAQAHWVSARLSVRLFAAQGAACAHRFAAND